MQGVNYRRELSFTEEVFVLFCSEGSAATGTLQTLSIAAQGLHYKSALPNAGGWGMFVPSRVIQMPFAQSEFVSR